MCGPPAVDRQRRAGDRGAGFACEKRCNCTKLLDSSEPLVGLLRQQNVADHLFTRNSVRRGLSSDLRLNERRINVAWADRIAGDVSLLTDCFLEP